MSELKEQSERVMELARTAGADNAIAEVIDSAVSQIRFSANRIDASNSWSEKHAIVLVAVGNRTMSTDLRDLDNAKQIVQELVSLAKRSPPNKAYGGIASGKFKYSKGRADKSIKNLRDPSRYVHDAIAGARSEGAIDVGGTMYVTLERNGIASTGGALAEDERAHIRLSVRAFAQPEASGQTVSCNPRLSSLKAREAGARAGELAKMAENPVQGEEGKFDLIMEPLFLGCLVQSIGSMLSALRVDIELSMFAKKIGKRVCSDEITFVDDPIMESTSGRAFDHEGVPTRRNVVIKDGVLRTYLHNTSTAKKFKTRTTASAGPLVPTIFTLATQPVAFHPVVLPGDWKAEEIIKDTKNGIYLNNTWYTRYQNYSTGDFSTIPRDALLKVENGEIVGPVKNIRVSDNMLDLLKSIDAVSKTSQEVFWWDEANPPATLPMIRAKAMSITRSS